MTKPVIVVLVVGLVVLCCCVVSVLLLAVGGVSVYLPFSSSDSITYLDTKTDKVTISQAYVSSLVTGESSNNDYNNDVVHYYHKVALNLMTVDEIDEVKVYQIELQRNSNQGEVKIIHPKHTPQFESTNHYFGPYGEDPAFTEVGNDGDRFTLKSVDKDFMSLYYDEVGTNMALINFSIFVHDFCRFDYEKIFNETGIIDGLRYLEYCDAMASELNEELDFVVEVKFKDGSIAVKNFSFEIDGDALLAGYASVSSELVGTQF